MLRFDSIDYSAPALPATSIEPGLTRAWVWAPGTGMSNPGMLPETGAIGGSTEPYHPAAIGQEWRV